jgi:hypothetical protein
MARTRAAFDAEWTHACVNWSNSPKSITVVQVWPFYHRRLQFWQPAAFSAMMNLELMAPDYNRVALTDPGSMDEYAESLEGGCGHAARARSAVAEIVPEIETYQWKDDYFEQSEHNVIAVFDHDPERLELSRRLLHFGLLKFCLPLFCFVLALTAVTNFEALSGVAGILSPVIVVGAAALLLSNKQTLQHTAVTTTGIVHIDKFSKYIQVRFSLPFRIPSISLVSDDTEANFVDRLT